MGVRGSAAWGDVATIAACSLTEGVTEPPPYLREHELIEAMDKQGIGTDASIPTHVQNIVDTHPRETGNVHLAIRGSRIISC